MTNDLASQRGTRSADTNARLAAGSSRDSPRRAKAKKERPWNAKAGARGEVSRCGVGWFLCKGKVILINQVCVVCVCDSSYASTISPQASKCRPRTSSGGSNGSTSVATAGVGEGSRRKLARAFSALVLSDKSLEVKSESAQEKYEKVLKKVRRKGTGTGVRATATSVLAAGELSTRELYCPSDDEAESRPFS